MYETVSDFSGSVILRNQPLKFPFPTVLDLIGCRTCRFFLLVIFFNFILFYFILFYFILFYFILFYFIFFGFDRLQNMPIFFISNFF